MLGAIFFAFQIYGDFSGYSDIAIGISRLFGFSLMKNFAFPYFSRDIAEFWRRWHISLSTWFRDYLYIPLGGSKGNLTRKIRNIFIIFIVSGFWHGANWTFIVWGALNALYFLPLLLLKKNRNNLNVVASGKKYPHIKDIMNMVITFMLTLVAWIFFRSNSITQAIGFIIELFAGLTDISSYMQSLNILSSRIGLATVFFLLFFIIIEWIGRTNNFAIEKIGVYMPRPYRWFFYYILVMIIFLFQGSQQQFIYFQF